MSKPSLIAVFALLIRTLGEEVITSEINPAVSISFRSVKEQKYNIQVSTDLQTWEKKQTLVGTGNGMTTFLSALQAKSFYRVVRVLPPAPETEAQLLDPSIIYTITAFPLTVSQFRFLPDRRYEMTFTNAVSIGNVQWTIHSHPNEWTFYLRPDPASPDDKGGTVTMLWDDQETGKFTLEPFSGGLPKGGSFVETKLQP